MNVEKRSVIFDLDGVLVNSMPAHIRSWQAAFELVAGIKVSDRELYLLEGMRGMELASMILEHNQIGSRALARKVSDEKGKRFRANGRGEPFDGVAKMLEEIKCPKAVVSGSARRDVESMLEENFGIARFAAIVTADDVERGKPDPTAFLEATTRLGVDPSQAVVVENAPLGAVASQKAGIDCFIALNNSPLLKSDFKGTVGSARIFEATRDLAGILAASCA